MWRQKIHGSTLLLRIQLPSGQKRPPHWSKGGEWESLKLLSSFQPTESSPHGAAPSQAANGMGGCASFPSPGGNAPVLVFALFLDEPRPSITSTKSRLGLGSSVLRTIQTGCIVVPTRDTSWETGLCVVAKIPRVYSVAEDPAPLWPEKAAPLVKGWGVGKLKTTL